MVIKKKKSFADLMEDSSNEIMENKFYSISMLANLGKNSTKIENLIRCLQMLRSSSNKINNMVNELIKEHFRKVNNVYKTVTVETDKGEIVGHLNTPQFATNCHPAGIGEPVYKKAGSYVIYHSHYHAGKDYPVPITKKNWDFIDFITKERG